MDSYTKTHTHKTNQERERRERRVWNESVQLQQQHTLLSIVYNKKGLGGGREEEREGKKVLILNVRTRGMVKLILNRRDVTLQPSTTLRAITIRHSRDYWKHLKQTNRKDKVIQAGECGVLRTTLTPYV